MAYKVDFTESNIKPSLQVTDQTVNEQTSLSFVGKNYSSYGSLIANNFLHLLENFASPVSPDKPVEGQLWYDNGVSTASLKVYDGVSWQPAGEIKKSPTAPSISSGSNGDLWVNTDSNQLFIASGTAWTLIGPQFSDGLKTGPVVELIVDTSNTIHSVITLYNDDNISAIISDLNFTPKSTIPKFPLIYKGITFADAAIVSNVTIHGTATNAAALVVSGISVDASKFLNKDNPGSINAQLVVNSNDGISVGTESEFSVNVDTGGINLISNSIDNYINISLTTAAETTTIMHLSPLNRVGINTIDPSVELDVIGDATVSGAITANSINIYDTLDVAKSSRFTDTVTVSTLVIDHLDDTGNIIDGTVIMPGYNTVNDAPVYDIGSPTQLFRNIYANQFIGNISGIITGEMVVSNSESIIDNVPRAVIAPDYETVGVQPLYDIGSETRIFRNIYAYRQYGLGTIQVGTIIPYAGVTIPDGYLLCNGDEISNVSYSELFSTIGYQYNTALTGLPIFSLPTIANMQTHIQYIIFTGKIV